MQWIYVVIPKVSWCIVAGRHLEWFFKQEYFFLKIFFKETLQVTSGNDASGNFCAHDINSLHELCYIFTKIKLPTEKSLKYVAISLKFASQPNSELFSQTK